MNAATQAKQQYLRNTVMSATSEQLHLMLLDGAIRFATRSREALSAREYEAMFNALDRAQRIVLELTAGLNREANPPLVAQMLALYEYIYAQLVKGSLNRDAQAIDDALKILRSQRETWQIIVDKTQRELPSRQHLPPTDASGAEITSAFVAEG